MTKKELQTENELLKRVISALLVIAPMEAVEFSKLCLKQMPAALVLDRQMYCKKGEGIPTFVVSLPEGHYYDTAKKFREERDNRNK